MTTLNVYDGDFWFVYDDDPEFGDVEIWFTADENMNGEWKPRHDFQAIPSEFSPASGDISAEFSETTRKDIITLIDQLFAEYQQGEAA